MGLALYSAPSALADTTVKGCVGIGSGVCVDVTTGSKNYSNKTQWVGWVTTRTFGGGNFTKLESWGDGFYFAKNFDGKWANRSVQWGAQRWVRSGTNVCGAATTKDGRTIACIRITV